MQKRTAISDFLLDKLRSGEVKPGGKLPSQTALMRRFQCSRTTVLLAVEALRRSGHVECRQGSGIFAAGDQPVQRQGTAIRRVLAIGDQASNILHTPYATVVQEMDTAGLELCFMNMRQVEERSAQLSQPGQAVIWLLPPEQMLPQIAHLRRLGVPQLLLNRSYGDYDAVWTDASTSIRLGMEWLLEHSGPEVAFIAPPPTLGKPYLIERTLAFYEACFALHAHLEPEMIFKSNFTDVVTEIDAVTKKIFSRPDHPRGIFILDFQVAVPFIFSASKYGKELGIHYFLLLFDETVKLRGGRGVAMLPQPLHLFQEEMERWLQHVISTGGASGRPFRKQLPCTLIKA